MSGKTSSFLSIKGSVEGFVELSVRHPLNFFQWFDTCPFVIETNFVRNGRKEAASGEAAFRVRTGGALCPLSC